MCKFNSKMLIVIGVAAFLQVNARSTGDVTLYPERSDWEAAVGTFTTIDVTQFPSQTIITDQYADLGVIFEGNNRIFETPLFVNDGHGLAGFGGTWIEFDEPMNWLAVDFPGFVWINLYDGDELFHESGGSGRFRHRIF